MIRRHLRDFFVFHLEVVAEDVSNERTVFGIGRVESSQEEIEEVVGSPEVKSLGEFKNQSG